MVMNEARGVRVTVRGPSGGDPELGGPAVDEALERKNWASVFKAMLLLEWALQDFRETLHQFQLTHVNHMVIT